MRFSNYLRLEDETVASRCSCNCNCPNSVRSLGERVERTRKGKNVGNSAVRRTI